MHLLLLMNFLKSLNVRIIAFWSGYYPLALWLSITHVLISSISRIMLGGLITSSKYVFTFLTLSWRVLHVCCMLTRVWGRLKAMELTTYRSGKPYLSTKSVISEGLVRPVL